MSNVHELPNVNIDSLSQGCQSHDEICCEITYKCILNGTEKSTPSDDIELVFELVAN